MGPMPPKVQPEKSPPNAPATNGQMAFATALAISSQSISSFMSFPFLVVVVVVCGVPSCEACRNSTALFCVAFCVLVRMWAVPTQRYSQYGKCCWFSRSHRSTIIRLPSGAPASHSSSFRDGASRFGVGTAHPCTRRVGGTSSHSRSARAVSFGVRLRIHSQLCGLWSRAEYRPSPYPRTSAASAQSRRPQRLRPRG